MAGKEITEDMAYTVKMNAVNAALEQCRPYYAPNESREFQDQHWLRVLMGQWHGLTVPLDQKGSDAFKQALATNARLEEADRKPLTYGFLSYQLAKALIKELGIEGEILIQQPPRPSPHALG